MDYVGTAGAATRDLMPPDDGLSATSGRESMIEHYKAIAASSRRMLDAARRDGLGPGGSRGRPLPHADQRAEAGWRGRWPCRSDAASV